MNKKELIEAVADMNDMTKSDVKEVLDATLETIQEALEEGETVEFIGFGKFHVTERKARDGRNPSTGAKIKIAASHGVRFKVGATLKAAVKEALD